MNTRNAKTLVTVERERERERESYSLKAIVVFACLNDKISLFTGRLYIIYRWSKVDMQLRHKEIVC